MALYIVNIVMLADKSCEIKVNHEQKGEKYGVWWGIELYTVTHTQHTDTHTHTHAQSLIQWVARMANPF